MKGERNYEVPKVEVYHILTEGVLCDSIVQELEGLGENMGTW